MNLHEAIRRRIPRVRHPQWDRGTYLRLPLVEPCHCGPLLELYDRLTQEACGLEIPQMIATNSVLCRGSNEFIPYRGELDPLDLET